MKKKIEKKSSKFPLIRSNSLFFSVIRFAYISFVHITSLANESSVKFNQLFKKLRKKQLEIVCEVQSICELILFLLNCFFYWANYIHFRDWMQIFWVKLISEYIWLVRYISATKQVMNAHSIVAYDLIWWSNGSAPHS